MQLANVPANNSAVTVVDMIFAFLMYRSFRALRNVAAARMREKESKLRATCSGSCGQTPRESRPLHGGERIAETRMTAQKLLAGTRNELEQPRVRMPRRAARTAASDVLRGSLA